jgi:hypothetical protein
LSLLTSKEVIMYDGLGPPTTTPNVKEMRQKQVQRSRHQLALIATQSPSFPVEGRIRFFPSGNTVTILFLF